MVMWLEHTWINAGTRGQRAIILSICVGLLLLGILAIRLSKILRDPAHNGDYDHVVHLVQSGVLKPVPGQEEAIALPQEYQYLSSTDILLISPAHETTIFFSVDANSDYMYLSDNEAPARDDFVSQISYHCDYLKPHWFACQYDLR